MPEATESSRRRRNPKASDKENDAKQTLVTTRTRKPRKKDLRLTDDLNLDLSCKENASLERFQSALEKTSSASFWKRHAALAEVVVQASQSLREKSTTSGSMLLEENTAELLSTCRSLVKDATERKETAQTVKLLYVAIHGLRAICPIITDSKKTEATIRILYHAVITASDVCIKHPDASVSVDAALQCIASFQALGSSLSKYKIPIELKTDSCVAFTWKSSKSPSALFPIPVLKSSKNASGTMTVKQLYKIALQATIAVGNALVHVFISSVNRKTANQSLSDFGPYASEILEATLQGDYDVIALIVQEVVVPWASVLSQSEVATAETIEDSLSYAKRAFRLLFDAASQIEKCSDKSARLNVELSSSDSLGLRRQAILTLLLQGGESIKLSSSMKDALKKSHWKDACTYASKASIAYRQSCSQHQGSTPDDCLDAFHQEIGAALDSLASDYSLSYVEYCARRALDVRSEALEGYLCKSKDCMFAQLGFRFVHRKCSSCSEAGQITLALFFGLLGIRDELDHSPTNEKDRGLKTADDMAVDDIDILIDRLIREFRSVLFEAEDSPSFDVQKRCLKLLEALSLNRKVYAILSIDSPVIPSMAQLKALGIAGRVLSECIGPLCYSLVRGAESKKQQYWDLAVDSHIRGLAAFDKVRDWRIKIEEPICDADSERTTMGVQALFEICNRCDLGFVPSEKVLEKAAKTIFSVGRVRRDEKEHNEALLPLCLGAELFSKLAEVRGLQSVHGLQLPMRYSHLSSVFASLDMTEEACLALLLAIFYDMADTIVTENKGNEDGSLGLFCEISSLTNGVVYMGANSSSLVARSSLVGRLVRLYERSRDSRSMHALMTTARLKDETSIEFVKRLLRSSDGGHHKVKMERPSASMHRKETSLGDLFTFIFSEPKWTSSVRTPKPGLLETECLKTAALVLSEYGIFIQQQLAKNSEDMVCDSWIEEVENLSQFCVTWGKRLFRDKSDAMRHVIVSLLRTLGASALMPAVVSDWVGEGATSTSVPEPSLLDSQKEDTARSQARKLATHASETLSLSMKKVPVGQERLAGTVLLGCVAFYLIEISGEPPCILSDTTKHTLFSRCKEGAQLFAETSISCSVKNSIGACLTRTLTRFQDVLNLEGDKLLAAQVALLVLRLNKDKETESWYRSIAGNLLQDGGLAVAAKDVIENDQASLHETTTPIGNDVQLNDVLRLEMAATRLRMAMHTPDVGNFNDSVREAEELLNYCIEVLGRPDTEQSTQLLLRWICSTCAMTLAEAFGFRGSPSSAVTYLRQGVKLCRQAVSALRRNPNSLRRTRPDSDSTPWTEVALSSFLLRLTERRIEGQRRVSIGYARLGDHRKSEAYAVGAANQCMMGDDYLARQRMKFHDLASMDRSALSALCQSVSYRLLLGLKARASSSELVVEAIRNDMSTDGLLSDSHAEATDNKISWQIDSVWNLINIGDMYFLSTNSPDRGFQEYYQVAKKEMKRLLSSPTNDILSSLSELGSDTKLSKGFIPLHAEVQLRQVRMLLAEPSQRNERMAYDLCLRITETPMALALCRAWAHFYLCLIFTKRARQIGALHQLWNGYSVGLWKERRELKQEDSSWENDPVGVARFHARKSLSLAGPASDVLSRDAMRTLALLTGPQTDLESMGTSAAALIHSSIGATARNMVTSAVASNDIDDGVSNEAPHANDISSDSRSTADHRKEEKLHQLFSALDTGLIDGSRRNENISFLFQEGVKTLPSSWRVAAVALCPTGEMLLTSFETSDESSDPEIETVCVFPEAPPVSTSDSTVYDEMIKPLDSLVRLNEGQIVGLDATTVTDSFNEEAAKRTWWNERQDADNELQNLVERIETKYFDSSCVRRTFLGDESDDGDSLSVPRSNLAARFEEACVMDDHESDEAPAKREDVQRMSVTELKEELGMRPVNTTTGKVTKQALVDMVIKARKTPLRRSAMKATRSSTDENSPQANEKCLLLILDENFQRFPFEGMDLFSGLAVSRIPSLPFAIAPLLGSHSESEEVSTKEFPLVNPANSSYIVDPEGNLSQTADRIVPVITDICREHGWKWRDVVGKCPSEEFVESALTQDNGLLLYCGHGGATSCFSRSKVEKLMTGRIDGNTESTVIARRCRSTIILMGCSSGKLVSVNRKDSKTNERVTMFYEPEGIALSYLCAGAPCVVGNLWDVTDRDIDRFCITLLDKFLQGDEEHSLAKCVADSRSSCKMRHLVGLAPVCYGVPVHLTKK